MKKKFSIVFEQEGTEGTENPEIPRVIVQFKFAPGRISLETPFVNLASLKLMISPNGTSSNFM